MRSVLHSKCFFVHGDFSPHKSSDHSENTHFSVGTTTSARRGLASVDDMAHVGSDAATLAQKHTFIRSYQACVPCRKRKVRCDLGDPGNPSDPPCRRCRREHKDCFSRPANQEGRFIQTQ